MPPGALLQLNPAATSPAASEPAGAAPLLQESVKLVPAVGRLTDWSAGPAVENSPALAKRKDEPQLPRTVAPIRSSTTQVNASFGLVVEPVRAGLPPYWS